jgi:hypothetical protein
MREILLKKQQDKISKAQLASALLLDTLLAKMQLKGIK